MLPVLRRPRGDNGCHSFETAYLQYNPDINLHRDALQLPILKQATTLNAENADRMEITMASDQSGWNL